MEKDFNEELNRVLDFFRDEEDSYKMSIYDENGECYDFYDEIEKVMNEFDITWDFTNCGGFDSPGYSIDCFCLAYIDKNAKLQSIPIAFECK